MKSINEINRNLDAVQQTRHITNAMYMLSVTAMRRGMMQIEFNRQYMRDICLAVKDILEKSPEVRNAFIHDAGTGKRDTAILAFASDKSLCGAYNHAVAAEVRRQIDKVTADGRQAVVYTSGQKLEEILRGRGIGIYGSFDGASQVPSMHHAYVIAQEMIDIFRSGSVQDIYVLFTGYRSAAEQPVLCHRLLPLAPENFQNVALRRPYAAKMTYEPSEEAVYEKLVPEYLQGFLYGCLCSAYVCENLARMTAMQSATHNADEMLKSLETAYNTARQQIITSELTEIAAATELMNKAI